MGYRTLAKNLLRFHELGALPQSLQLERLDDGQGIEKTLITHNAKWHKFCRMQFNNILLKRAEKRHGGASMNPGVPQKRTRSHTSTSGASEDVCFFCGQGDDNDELHDASTFELDRRVRRCATLIEDTELLGKLSGGDMTALEGKYHAKCLVALYNKARAPKKSKETESDEEKMLSGLVFAELVMFIEETRSEENVAPVFRLADLVHFYEHRMEQFGVKMKQRAHSTCLKQRILGSVPSHASSKQRP